MSYSFGSKSKDSAINLTLDGTVGTFSVGSLEGQNSIEVKYFLTHVGLDFENKANEPLLSHLAPVRELFDFKDLDFDQIMQRDIDDARVSKELIPYLLDATSRDLIKIFPPIIVVVLPTHSTENKPASLYPTVDTFEAAFPGDKHQTLVTRAGAVGNEVFQFEQPVDIDGFPSKHDFVRFKLNTYKTKLVIVDGQHRAMALLALYRNLKGESEWSDKKREPFRDYYEEWTSDYIQQFQLKEINMPIMFCTFPGLCEGKYEGSYDLTKAARSIFLTLNKTARKVSDTRNKLLDDNDLIALFMRRCLSHIKDKNVRAASSLRITNVELDQFDDKQKIQSPIAITGVNHVYYIIEHLLFNKVEDVNGAKPRGGVFKKRKDLNLFGFMDRLNGRNALGPDAADSMSRESFTLTHAEHLADKFDDYYGKYIISVFEKFLPFDLHDNAVLELQQDLESFQDRKLYPILFEGQGIGKVFEKHRENLKTKIQDKDYQSEVPQLEQILRRLEKTEERKQQAIRSLEKKRAIRFLSSISDKSKLKITQDEIDPKLVTFINFLYDNIFTTVAFETATVCTFFGEMERAFGIGVAAGSELEAYFEDYMLQLNNFFIPNSSAQFKKLIRLFAGEIEGELHEWKIIPSKQTFKMVVNRSEMQPEQWPKYKYLILEIWCPSEERLSVSIGTERNKCRHQIFKSLYEDSKKIYARENTKHEEALDENDRNKIIDSTYIAFTGFLKILGIQNSNIPSKLTMANALDKDFEDTEPEIEQQQDIWQSISV